MRSIVPRAWSEKYTVSRSMAMPRPSSRPCASTMHSGHPGSSTPLPVVPESASLEPPVVVVVPSGSTVVEPALVLVLDDWA
jgi:hypothetical protein